MAQEWQDIWGSDQLLMCWNAFNRREAFCAAIAKIAFKYLS